MLRIYSQVDWPYSDACYEEKDGLGLYMYTLDLDYTFSLFWAAHGQL